jgi:addiction module RelE/StbE family toxin
MIIKFSKRFKKLLKKAPQNIRITFKNKYKIFIIDEYNPVLRNHSLAGEHEGCRSINITGDWRVVFREYEDENLVVFLSIGTHSQLYN